MRERVLVLRKTLPVTRAVLFGSWAKGRQTAASDVDVLVVYSGEPNPDAYKIVWETLAIPRLEPHVYDEREFEQVRGTVERMVLDGIPVDR